MLISTKGRYALRVMIDLAEHNNGRYMVLMDIAKRQDISEKYLESIIAVLSRAGLVQAQRGRGGGYRLAREPETYTVGSILKLTEAPLVPVACVGQPKEGCERRGECRTLPMWQALAGLLDDFFEGISLADLMADGGAKALKAKGRFGANQKQES
jgi:Rrf2 family iron-sulfur cluster assembly transcriptional regulator